MAEQVVDADDFAGVIGKAQQQSHRPHLDPNGLSVSGHLAGRRVDAPRADTKTLRALGGPCETDYRASREFSSYTRRHFRTIQDVSDRAQDLSGPGRRIVRMKRG